MADPKEPRILELHNKGISVSNIAYRFRRYTGLAVAAIIAKSEVEIEGDCFVVPSVMNYDFKM